MNGGWTPDALPYSFSECEEEDAIREILDHSADLDEDEPSPVANVAAQEDALIRMIDASDPLARVRAAERAQARGGRS